MQEKNKGGRPKAQIDIKEFEKLCALQCTLTEIAGWFNCCEDTIENFCKREYKMGFSEIFRQKREAGRISLRRYQFQQAEKNPTMAIWLGKQYLGQHDQIKMDINQNITNETIQEVNDFINGIE